MGKSIVLKDADWEGFKKALVPGSTLMMMGTPSQVIQAITETSTTKFVEDLPPESQMLAAENLAPGLENLGNTCYMNASLQMMNAMPELGDTLAELKSTEAQGSGGKMSLAMKDVVQRLRNQKETVTPFAFLLLLRQYFPRFAEKDGDHYAQQSADECFVQLVQCFKALPKLNKDPMAFGNSGIEQLLTGEMIKTTKCITVAEENPTTEVGPFEILHSHVGKGITYLFQGVNQALNSELVKRSPTTNAEETYSVTDRISRLPYYLTVQFLRFEWNKFAGKGGNRAKILRPVEFPFELDAYEFCSEELKTDLKAKREEVRVRNDTPAAERKPIEQRRLSNDTAYYELAAVLTHQGRDADSGHYVCWVRQEGDKWILFDDNKVSGATPEDIKKLVGQGTADWHQAYMLLYRTKQFN